MVMRPPLPPPSFMRGPSMARPPPPRLHPPPPHGRIPPLLPPHGIRGPPMTMPPLPPHRFRQRPPPPSLPYGMSSYSAKRIMRPPPPPRMIQQQQSKPNTEDKPWMTESLKYELNKKHKLYYKAKKTNSPKDWNAFKDQRKKVALMNESAKIEYIGNHPEKDVEKIMAEIYKD